jgi:hypothetical protein
MTASFHIDCCACAIEVEVNLIAAIDLDVSFRELTQTEILHSWAAFE